MPQVPAIPITPTATVTPVPQVITTRTMIPVAVVQCTSECSHTRTSSRSGRSLSCGIMILGCKFNAQLKHSNKLNSQLKHSYKYNAVNTCRNVQCSSAVINSWSGSYQNCYVILFELWHYHISREPLHSSLYSCQASEKFRLLT
jgi:hypothetical protein